VLLDALLGFEDEVGAFVEVDEVGGGFAVGGGDVDGAVEDVVVLGVVGDGGFGVREGEGVAEFGEEKLVVGPPRVRRRRRIASGRGSRGGLGA
jgi:hypothetical protein